MISKLRFAGLLVFASVCAIASIAQPPSPGSGITGIAHIAFRVSDLDREIVFLGKLGYEESFAMNNAGKTTEVFVKVNDRQFIELYPQTAPSQPLGWMHVCFEAGDLNALQKYYVGEGLNPSPVQKAAAGNLISSMKDPEGRVTEFTQYMPGSRHSLDKGQHLGMGRVSEELLGFELPVREGAAMKEFYTLLGFEAEEASSNVRLSTAGAPDMRIELHPARAGSVPQFIFPVPDARRAAEQLRAAGVGADRSDKLVFVTDPDGNKFVFIETGSPGASNLLPWTHYAVSTYRQAGNKGLVILSGAGAAFCTCGVEGSAVAFRSYAATAPNFQAFLPSLYVDTA